MQRHAPWILTVATPVMASPAVATLHCTASGYTYCGNTHCGYTLTVVALTTGTLPLMATLTIWQARKQREQLRHERRRRGWLVKLGLNRSTSWWLSDAPWTPLPPPHYDWCQNPSKKLSLSVATRHRMLPWPSGTTKPSGTTLAIGG